MDLADFIKSLLRYYGTDPKWMHEARQAHYIEELDHIPKLQLPELARKIKNNFHSFPSVRNIKKRHLEVFPPGSATPTESEQFVCRPCDECESTGFIYYAADRCQFREKTACDDYNNGGILSCNACSSKLHYQRRVICAACDNWKQSLGTIDKNTILQDGRPVKTFGALRVATRAELEAEGKKILSSRCMADENTDVFGNRLRWLKANAPAHVYKRERSRLMAKRGMTVVSPAKVFEEVN